MFLQQTFHLCGILVAPLDTVSTGGGTAVSTSPGVVNGRVERGISAPCAACHAEGTKEPVTHGSPLSAGTWNQAKGVVRGVQQIYLQYFRRGDSDMPAVSQQLSIWVVTAARGNRV